MSFLFPPAPPHPPAFVQPEPCLFQITFVRLWTGESFWFFPTSIGFDEISGYRWNGVFWMSYSFNRRFIYTADCPPIPTLY